LKRNVKKGHSLWRRCG